VLSFFYLLDAMLCFGLLYVDGVVMMKEKPNEFVSLDLLCFAFVALTLPCVAG
jgi:hypothetical protein